ncbi:MULTISPECIES: hypothetical protein [Bacteroidales]|jgi:hypothetical protein|nr:MULTISPECIES: hypothetical protein [Bacteroidales]MBS4827056.1 hypothetical protein [Bacteroides sp.]MBX9058475.1 hypothetical protein [Parabacteroides distasonis]MDB9104939.1 hypothetical protein [Parabacteroides distasonis]
METLDYNRLLQPESMGYDRLFQKQEKAWTELLRHGCPPGQVAPTKTVAI